MDEQTNKTETQTNKQRKSFKGRNENKYKMRKQADQNKTFKDAGSAVAEELK